MASPLLVVGVVLALLAVAGLLARRVGQSVIPAYLLLGVAVGPAAPQVSGYSLTLLANPDLVRVFADLGVVLLLFFVGVELELDSILRRWRFVLKAGAADVGISLTLGYLLGLAFGFSLLEAFVLALVVFNSSTVIVAKLLIELDWVANPESEAILSVVVFEDVVTALAFAVASAFVLGRGATLTGVGVSTLSVVAVVAAGIGVALYGARYVERAFDVDAPELFALAVLGTVATVAGLGLRAGVSDAVAAFLVGLAFGRTDHVPRLETLLGPSRDLFAAIFFFTIGLATDPRALGTMAVPVAVAVAVTVPGQLVSGYLAGLAFGLEPRRAARVGTALAPRGEFSLVIAAFVAVAGTTPVLRETIPVFTVGYVLVTSVLGTVLMRSSDVFEALAERYAGRRSA